MGKVNFIKVASFLEINDLKFTEDNFNLFLAVNFTEVPDNEILYTAKKLIYSGLCCVGICGLGCEKGSDIFDYANILWEQENRAEFGVLSIWYENKTIEESIDSFILNITPKEKNITEYSTNIVCVGGVELENIEIYCSNRLNDKNSKFI